MLARRSARSGGRRSSDPAPASRRLHSSGLSGTPSGRQSGRVFELRLRPLRLLRSKTNGAPHSTGEGLGVHWELLGALCHCYRIARVCQHLKGRPSSGTPRALQRRAQDGQFPLLALRKFHKSSEHSERWRNGGSRPVEAALHRRTAAVDAGPRSREAAGAPKARPPSRRVPALLETDCSASRASAAMPHNGSATASSTRPSLRFCVGSAVAEAEAEAAKAQALEAAVAVRLRQLNCCGPRCTGAQSIPDVFAP